MKGKTPVPEARGPGELLELLSEPRTLQLLPRVQPAIRYEGLFPLSALRGLQVRIDAKGSF